jgi:hypothetical protein
VSRVSVNPGSSVGARLRAAGLVLLIAALPLASCTEVESESAAGYEPSKLEPVKGSEDRDRVVFTAEAARRAGLRTAAVAKNGGGKVVPYAALIYDPEGKAYVYVTSKPLSYLREEVVVDRVEGNRVFLSDGPKAGAKVVTVGAAEVYGTELEVSSH